MPKKYSEATILHVENMIAAQDMEQIKSMISISYQMAHKLMHKLEALPEAEKIHWGKVSHHTILLNKAEQVECFLSKLTSFEDNNWGMIKTPLVELLEALNRCSDILESIHYRPSAFVTQLNQDIVDEKSIAPTKQLLMKEIKTLLVDGMPHFDITTTSMLAAQTNPYHALSPSEFAHIHGENFIAHTGLEGNTALAITSIFLKYLENITPTFSTNQESIDNLNRLTLLIKKRLNFKKENLSPSELQEMLDSLQIDEECLMFGGWKGKPGHAIYFKLKKQADSRFSVKIYNSGAGLSEYHPSVLLHGYEERFQLFLEMKNVTRERLLSPYFIQPLTELRTTTNHAGARNFYESLFLGLDGELVDQVVDVSSFSTPQQSGVCSWSSLLALAHDYLPDQSYLLFVHRIKLQSLCDFYLSIQKSEMVDELHSLLQYSLEQFSREVLKLYRSEILSEGEYQRAAATAIQIGESIHHLWIKNKLKTHATAPLLDFKELNITPFSTPVKDSTITTVPTNREALADNAESLSSYFYEVNIEDIENPHNIASTLMKCELICETLHQKRDYRALASFITNVLEKLPIPQIQGSDFWKTVVEEDRRSCQKPILSFIEKLLCARQKLPEEYHQRLEDIINVHNTFLIQHRIMVLNEDLDAAKWYFPIIDKFNRCFAFSAGSDISGTPSFGDHNLYNVSYLYRLQKMTLYKENCKRSMSAIDVFDKNELNEPILTQHLKSLLDNEQIQKKLDSLPEFELFFSATIKECKDLLALQHSRDSLSPSLPDEVQQLIKLILRKYNEKKALFYAHEISPALFMLRANAIIAQYFLVGELQANNLLDGDLQTPLAVSLKPNGEEVDTFVNGSWTSEKPHYTKDAQRIMGDVFPLRINDPDLRKFFHITSSYFGNEHDSATRLYNLDHAYYTIDDFSPSSEIRQLLRVRSVYNVNQIGPYPSASIQWQPPKVLNFFEENFQKLQHPDYRKLFFILLLECDYLEQHLLLAPEFSQKIQSFCDQGVKRGFEMGEYKVAAFFLDLKRRVCHRIPSLQDNLEQTQAETELLNKIRSSGSVEDISIACQILITAMADKKRPLDFNEVSLLVWAYNHYKTFPIPTLFQDAYLNHRVERAFQDKAADIKHILDINGDRLIQKVTESLDTEEDIAVTKWEVESFPLCVSNDGRYRYNIMTATFSDRNRTLVALLPAIKEHASFRKIFGETKAGFFQQLTLGSFESLDRSVRLHLNQGQLTIQRLLGDQKWYQYLPLLEIPSSLREGINKPIFFEAFTAWVSCDDQEQKSVVLLDDKKPKYTIYLNPQSNEITKVISDHELLCVLSARMCDKRALNL